MEEKAPPEMVALSAVLSRLVLRATRLRTENARVRLALRARCLQDREA
jgi:hypothetical protein